MTETLASLFIEKFNCLGIDDDGRIFWDEYENFLSELSEETQTWQEECPESCDSTRCLLLTDGSILHLHNPQQAYYGAYVD